MTARLVGVRLIQPLLDYLRAREVSAGPLLRHVGLKAEDVADPDAQIEAARVAQLWERAALRLRDPLLGLRVGAEVTRDSFDLLSQAVSVSATLRDMGARFSRFSPLAVPKPLYTLRERGERAFWILRPVFPGKHCMRHLCELAVSLGVAYTRRYTRDASSVATVFFDHAPAADVALYRQVLGVPVTFSAGESGFELPRRWLDVPLAQADQGLSRVLDRYAEQTLRARPQEGDLVARVADSLERQLTKNLVPSLASTARELSVSSRSLQRSLAQQDQSFQALLDLARKRLALQLLTREKVSIAVTSERLGFSDPAAFRRAFKRWTGKSPSQHQKGADSFGKASKRGRLA